MHLATGSYGIGAEAPDPVIMCRMSLVRDPEALPLKIQRGTCSKPCSYGSPVRSHDPGSQSRRYLEIHVKDAGSNTLVVMAREGVPALGAGGFPVRSRDHKKRHLDKGAYSNPNGLDNRQRTVVCDEMRLDRDPEA